MAAGDMARLVRQHPGQLVRGLGGHEESGVDEDVLPARHEGVQDRIADDVEMHVAWLEARRPEDRVHDLAQGGLDLGVADDDDSRGLPHADAEHDQRGREAETDTREP